MSQSRPLGKDEGDGIDWDNLLDMDLIDEPSYPLWPGTQGTSTSPTTSEVARSDSAPVVAQLAGLDNLWQAEPFPHHQPYDVNAESRRWPPQEPVADLPEQARKIDSYIPPAARPLQVIDPCKWPPSRQMQSIDDMISNPLDLHSLGSAAVMYPDSHPLDSEMRWLSDISSAELQRPLGSHVQPLLDTEDRVSMPWITPSGAIDPLRMGPASFSAHESHGSGNMDWEERLQPTKYPGSPRPLIEATIDSSLRTAPIDFIPDNYTQSRNRNLQKNDRLAHPPSESPAPITRSSPSRKPASKPKTRRARSSPSSTAPQPEKQGPCLTCGKNYRTSTSPGRCGRCGIKWERSQAGPPSYTLDPKVQDLEAAREVLFPMTRGRRLEVVDDDFEEIMREEGIEEKWVKRFLVAMCRPVPEEGLEEEEDEEEANNNGEEERTSKWSRNQQTTFNQKAKMEREGEFSSTFVTARLRALWWQLVVFHGGGRGLYPVGGDSSGYAEDSGMGFGERLEAIEGVLRRDKRTVMDVVEGRGVAGFVGNPWGFHKRKDANNGCNVKKKHVLMKRVRREDEEKGRGKGRKRASRASSMRKEDRDDGGGGGGGVDGDGRLWIGEEEYVD